jgi:pimeloyl-ACP methyl ester carboxylesterase
VGRVAEDDEIDAWAWWRRDESTGLYYGLEEGLARIADAMREAGGVDGVIGFSQGAAAAAMVASLLERDRPAAFAAAAGGMEFPRSFVGEDGERVNGPLKFAVSYSGFFAPHQRYRAFYEPKIRTPVLHVIGSLDTVVEEDRTRGLVERCVGGEERVVVHPGGHFVPVGKEWVGALVGFIRDVVGQEGKEEEKGKEEESVEDMDMPF